MPKYLLIFEKGEPVRWLGHLDILRTFERAIRRAGLPIAFSQGFNPRAKISFGSALGTGITGGEERSLLELTEPVAPEAIREALNAALPTGIRIHDCQEVAESGSGALLSGYDRAEYAVVCVCPTEFAQDRIEVEIAALLARTDLPVTREKEGRTKVVNIRPALYHLALCGEDREAARVTLTMIVGQGESGTAKPAEVVAALAEQLPGMKARRSHRVRLVQGMRAPVADASQEVPSAVETEDA